MANVIRKDLVIVGGGPAGLSAGIYATRALLDTVILEKEAVGGQTILTTEIDNYPGMPHTDGFTIADTMQKQAEDLGAQVVMGNVVALKHDGTTGLFEVITPEATYARLSFPEAQHLATPVLKEKSGLRGMVFRTALPVTECFIGESMSSLLAAAIRQLKNRCSWLDLPIR